MKYSIERAIDPKTQSPGAGFFGAMKGHAEMQAGTATNLPGVAAVDDRTVRFELTRPDATFLHVMAINFASIVPKEEVEKAAGDFGKKPVGSGTFRLADGRSGSGSCSSATRPISRRTCPISTGS